MPSPPSNHSSRDSRLPPPFPKRAQPVPTAATASPALSRFRASQSLDQDAWRDGTPYDLAAFAELTRTERANILAETFAKPTPLDWRDMDLLAADVSPPALKRLRDELVDGTPESRVWALSALFDTGTLNGGVFDNELARLLNYVSSYDGLARALLLVEQGKANELPAYPITPNATGAKTRAALLDNIRRRPEVAVNFAFSLAHLEGLIDSPHDWAHRPLFLRLGKDNTPDDRAAALVEFSRLIGLRGSSLNRGNVNPPSL